MVSVFIEKKNITGSIIKIINKNDINHLKNSFRLNISDIIRVVDGEKEYKCEIISIDKKEILVKIHSFLEDSYTSSVKVDIAIGLLKNDKMDLSIQKLTEIGINKILPMITERTVVKLTNKKNKWDIIAIEALKQCQGVKKIVIEEPVNIKKIDYDQYDIIFLPYEKANENKITNYKNLKKHNKILYIIGPEGGLSESEIIFLKEKNAKVVSLGKRILRAETAAIVAGGIILNEIW